MVLLRQSVGRNRTIFMVDSTDHITGKSGLTLTITSSKNGAAFASITPTVTDLGSGWYNLALTTSHTDTLGDLALHVTGTGADPTDALDQVVAFNFDVSLATSTEVAAVQADTDDIQTRLPAALVSGRMDSSVGAMAANTLTASALATDAVTEIAGGVWDLARSGHSTSGTFGEGVASVQGNVTGSVGSVTGNVGGSVASVVGSVGSVTGNVGGNVTGSVGSVATDGITSASLATSAITEIQTGLATSSALSTVDSNVTAIKVVTDELSDTLELDSGNYRFTAAALAEAPTGSTPAQVAAAVWDEPRSSHVISGSFGQGVASVQGAVTGSVAAVLGSIGGSVAGSVLGNVSGSVGSVNAAVTVGTNQDKTGYALSTAGVDAILDDVVEGTYTFRQLLRLFAAALGGKLSGAATTTVLIRNLEDTKDVIMATVDNNGNRTAVVLDVS